VSGASVQLQSVDKVFLNGVKALSGLSLNIGAGEFVALLGPSGCGKSTALRLIAQLEKPTAGSVTTQASSDQGEIAYVFQDAHLLPWRTVLSNVALPLELRGVSESERLARAREALITLGLGDALNRYPSELSGGMKMRVSLARALVTRPKLLLLDEPFAALDEVIRTRLGESLRELWQSHPMTVVFVTHSLTESAFLADRALVLSKRPGHVVADHSFNLPKQRPARIRSEAPFLKEVSEHYEVFVQERMADE
jgi:NitT/TauT family transport system ATP-binding protein